MSVIWHGRAVTNETLNTREMRETREIIQKRKHTLLINMYIYSENIINILRIMVIKYDSII
jgi:hypothetical protein